MNQRKIKKKQHYVPQCYLKRFTIEGEKSLIWSIDKHKGEYLRSPSSIKRICYKYYYYYQINDNDEIDHITMENAFSELEKHGDGCLEKVCNSSVDSRVNITEKEQGELAFFLALLFTRVPSFRDGYHDLSGEILTSALKIAYSQGRLPDMPDVLKDLVNEKGIENVLKIQIHPFVSLEPMIKLGKQIAFSMLQKKWTFYRLDSYNGFVTSDNPVSFITPNEKAPIGPAHPLAILTIPLSKNMAVIISPAKEKDANPHNLRVVPASKTFIDIINKNTILAANNSIFTSQKNEYIHQLVNQAKGTSQKLSVYKTNDGAYSVIENPYLE